jgi:hypothetical protein
MSVSTDAVQQSWFPTVVLAMGKKAQISLNIKALPVSIGGIVEEFNRWSIRSARPNRST